MRNLRTENVLEHSAMVAMFAHSLAIIHNKLNNDNISADHVGMIALFHETGEVITGDMPTPVKYFNSDITKAYKEIESDAERKLISTLPSELNSELSELIEHTNEKEYALVKYADTLCAYVKCIEECENGNSEFSEAKKATEKKLSDYNSNVVDYFMKHFVTAFGLSLDKLSKELNK